MKSTKYLNYLAWILGVAFYYQSFLSVQVFDLMNFFLFFVLGLFSFPPSFRFIQRILKAKTDLEIREIARLIIIIAILTLVALAGSHNIKTNNKAEETKKDEQNFDLSKNDQKPKYHPVKQVIDGDTIKVDLNGTVESVRLIGIDSPESFSSNGKINCFGLESSRYLKNILSDKKVRLEIDESQGNRDKYSRLLRYVFDEDEKFINLGLVKGGFAYEYTYDSDYKYKKYFINAQAEARSNNRGLWGPNACSAETNKKSNEDCLIKGNISFSNQEKIYHLPGCRSYEETIINPVNGEQWFCTETDALAAGWRKAGNCP